MNNNDCMDRGRLNREFISKSPVCVFCGCDNVLNLTIDHKLALSRGGADDDKNKQVACWVCNNLKDSYTNKEFKEYMKALKILHKLCVVKMMMPSNIPIKFRQGFYPSTKKQEEVSKKC